MSDEDDFDGEKTQFWLPGKGLPGQPTAGDAAGETAGNRVSAEPDRRPQEPAPGASGDPGGGDSIDFDLTAEEPSGPTGLDFDITAEKEAAPATLDFDISGQGASEPSPVSHTEPTPRPPVGGSSASGGGRLLVALIAIVGVVIYFMTR